jgi:hypothetical protein
LPWTIDHRLGLLLEQPRKVAHLFERILDGRHGTPEIVLREPGILRRVAR